MNEDNRISKKVLSGIIDSVLQTDGEKRLEQLEKITDFVKIWGVKSIPDTQFNSIKDAIHNRDNRWINMINGALDEYNPNVMKTTLMNFGYNAFVKGTKKVRRNREKYHCNIPWLILFDPTSACNMHCDGCWAGTYGNYFNLSPDDMDKIVTEGKELGIYLYMLTGGEPLVRKEDVLALAKKHNDAQFVIFTNSTLIDNELCKDVQKLGNIVFLLSVEGTPETNDARRGEGHYEAVMNAMSLLKEYGIIFGTSICYTKYNVEAVTSDAFLRMLSYKGAKFGFYFHYMPVGNNANTDLLPTPAQRKYMIKRIRYIRSDDCDISFLPMDFQNDGEFVGGCIAGGRNYFHINSAGDAEPCVFIHYADSNIHTSSLLEILQSPLFMAYYNNQPFNSNHLRPCPMLENPDVLRKLVKSTCAINTNLDSREDVDKLCDKCVPYANDWAITAEKIWNSQAHHVLQHQNYNPENRTK